MMPSTTIVGTNSSADVQLVQNAINQNRTVFLKGTFNFTGGESTPGGQEPLRVITIANSVRIVGDGLNMIIGGERPFYVNNSQAEVSFEVLNFRNSMRIAIQSKSAKNLVVKGCRFFGMIPMQQQTPGGTVVNFASAISGTATGTMSILDNTIEMGNENDSSGNINSTNGMNLTGPTQNLEISNNNIRKTTAHGIDLRNITGAATIKRNNITTGNIGRGGGVGNFVDGIRCTGEGTYSIVESNTVDMGFENGAAIRLGGLINQNPSTSSNPSMLSNPSPSKVTGNVVRVTPLSNKSPGPWSAGIQVQGSCEGVDIEGNTISGRARSALSVVFSDFPLDLGSGNGNPKDTKLTQNDHRDLDEILADIEIQRAEGTVVTALGWGSVSPANRAEEDPVTSVAADNTVDGTIVDHGIRTVIHGNYIPV